MSGVPEPGAITQIEARAVDSPTISNGAVAKLLLAVFFLPVLDFTVNLLENLIPWLRHRDLTSYPFAQIRWQFTWCLQIGLVLDVIGGTATRVPARWAALGAAAVFLLMQPADTFTTVVFLSLATVTMAWLVWDESSFAWRAQLGTLFACVVVCLWYAVFARRNAAAENTLMVLHIAGVAGTMMVARWFGWQWKSAASSLVERDSQDRFSFAQMLVWVACCGVGLTLLRFVNFGAAYTIDGSALFRVASRSRIFSLVAFGVLTPGCLGLLAIAATIHQKWFRYWLPMLFVTGFLLLAAAVAVNEDLFVSRPTRMKSQWFVFFVSYIVPAYLAAALPTAFLMIYRSAGYRWTRSTIAAVARAR